MSTLPLPSTLASQKEWLVNEIKRTASWHGHVATLFPDDGARNVRCSDTLNSLAITVTELPVTHPLFIKLDQIDRVVETVRERWIDEIKLEFSHIGHHPVETLQQMVLRLIEITEACLEECRQAGKLH